MAKKYKNEQEFSAAIKELSSYNIAKRRIQELKSKRTEIIEELYSVKGTDYSKICVQGGVADFRFEELLETLEKLTKKISQEIEQNERLLDKINQRIEQVDFFRGEVLHCYYIRMMNISSISRELAWSERTVKRYKIDGLREYQRLLEGKK